MPRYFTVEITSTPLPRAVTEDECDVWASAVFAESDLAAATCGMNRRHRTIDVTACVDVQDEELARSHAIAAFRRAGERAGLGRLEVASIVLTPDGSEPDDNRA